MNLIKKVSIILLCIIMLNCFAPSAVRAEVSWTGKLTEPIIDFTLFLGDGVVSILHRAIFDSWQSVIRIDLTWDAGDIAGVILGGIITIAGVVAILAIPGIREAAIAAASGTIATILAGAAATAGAVIVGGFVIGAGIVSVWNSLPDDRLVLPQYAISAEEIFSNEIALFDVDFFNPMGYKDAKGNWVQDYVIYENPGDASKNQIAIVPATAGQLQSTIASWYKALRNIAIVASLSILVYIGIRILLSSISSDKAKYKEMIMDWVIALCLLFIMQYIMSFSNIIVDKITDLVTASREKTMYTESLPYNDKVLESINKAFEAKGAATLTEADLGVQDGADGKKYFSWVTNMMGHMRIGAQTTLESGADGVGYTVCFMVLVFYTVFFAFTYIKRVLYMAFLTMVAPLVALTYPIDKINDGKAQAFNMWLREYIFNLLIQPMHLLLYTVLISSALELVGKSIIYGIVAIGFMMPAEKLMRKFFGFEKAQTPGMLNGAAGAAMVMSGMNSLLNKRPGGGRDGSGGKGGKSGSDSDDKEKAPRFKDFDPEGQFLGNDHGDGGDNSGKPPKEVSMDNATDDQLALQEAMGAYRDGDVQDGDDYRYSGDYTDDERALAEAMDSYYNGDVDDGGSYRYSGDYTDDDRALLEAMEGHRNGDVQDGDNFKYSGDYTDDERALAEAMGAYRSGNIDNGDEYTFSEDRDIDQPGDQNRDEPIDQNQNNQNNQRQNNQSGQNPLPRQQTINNKPESKGRRLGRAIHRTGRLYAHGMANKVSNKVKNAHLGRKAIRMASGAAIGATAATIGLAAGVASGDPSKAFQYSVAGATGGYKLGSATSNKAMDALKVEGVDAETFKKEYYGKQEYQDRQIQKEVRKKQKDLTLRWSLEDKLGSKEKAKNYIEQEVPEIIKYGDFDDKTLVAMAQMQVKDNYSREEAVAAAMMSEQYLEGKNSTKLGDKASLEFEKTLRRRGAERIQDSDKDKEKELQDKYVKTAMERINKLDKYRYD